MAKILHGSQFDLCRPPSFGNQHPWKNSQNAGNSGAEFRASRLCGVYRFYCPFVPAFRLLTSIYVWQNDCKISIKWTKYTLKSATYTVLVRIFLRLISYHYSRIYSFVYCQYYHCSILLRLGLYLNVCTTLYNFIQQYLHPRPRIPSFFI